MWEKGRLLKAKAGRAYIGLNVWPRVHHGDRRANVRDMSKASDLNVKTP